MTLKPSSQLNFSRGNTPINPYEDLMRSTGVMAQALTAQDAATERDRRAVLDARKMDLEVAAAQRAEEAAKMQRTEWAQKQDDRTADRGFLADVAKAPEYTYGDITGEVTSTPEAKAQVDELMVPKSIMDKVVRGTWNETAKTMTPNDYSALSPEEKAQMAAIEDKQALTGQDLVEKAKYSLSKVEQIEDVLKNSKNLTPTMYAALETAKEKEKTEAAAAGALIAEERKGLETYLRDLRKDTAKDLVTDIGTYTLESSTGGGSTSGGTGGSKTKAASGWAADKTVQDQLNELSPLGWGSDTTKGERLAQIAMTKGLSANEFKDILASATTEGASGYRTFRGNTFINPETGEEDSGMYLSNKIDELVTKKEASGYGGSTKTNNKTVGFYNKNDPRAALSYRANEIANTEARINALRGISTTPKTRAEKEAAANIAIRARLAQGLDGASPAATATPAVNSAIKTPQTTAETQVDQGPRKARVRDTSTVTAKKETPELSPITRPIPTDFDLTSAKGKAAYVKAAQDYGKYAKTKESIDKGLAQQKLLSDYQNRLVRSAKDELVRLPALYNQGKITIDEYKARKKALEDKLR